MAPTSATADRASGTGAAAPAAGPAALQCPSAHPALEGARILGVVDRAAGEPRLAYLREPAPVTPDLLSLAGPLSPTRVFRFAAPCAGQACQHFDGSDCRLAKRIVAEMPEAVAEVAVCSLRPACRWWKQEGAAACRRCPMIVTESDHLGGAAEERLQRVADPASPV